CLANRYRALPILSSEIGAQLATCTLLSCYRAGPSLSRREGRIGEPPRHRTWIACMASRAGVEPAQPTFGGPVPSPSAGRMRENMAPRVGFEPTIVGLEDRLPSFGRGELERALESGRPRLRG